MGEAASRASQRFGKRVDSEAKEKVSMRKKSQKNLYSAALVRQQHSCCHVQKEIFICPRLCHGQDLPEHEPVHHGTADARANTIQL